VPRDMRGTSTPTGTRAVTFVQVMSRAECSSHGSVKPSAKPTLVRTQHLLPETPGQSHRRGIASAALTLDTPLISLLLPPARISLDRFPAPAIIVLADDRLTVSGYAVHAVISV
jgi:hypothetical protein